MTPPTWKTRATIAIKAALTVLVLGFVARHVARTGRDLGDRGRSVRVEPAWFAGSVALYLLGLACFGVFFWRVMAATSTPIRAYPALRAYLVSHLGKYVPGKAMVVVIRAGLVVPLGPRAATATFATLYETLTMMAAGGLVAALGFATGSSPWAKVPLPGGREVEAPPGLVGLGLGLAFLVVVAPGVFPRLATLASAPLRSVGPDAWPRLSARLLAEGLAWSTLGWALLGLSQVAVIRALGAGLPPAAWPLAVASVALATVAGFVVPIAPGGLGVREWVLWTALASAIDEDLAVVSALALRLAWVVGEVLAGAACFAIRPRPGERGPGTP